MDMDIDEDRPLHSLALSERGKFVSEGLFWYILLDPSVLTDIVLLQV